MSCWFIVLGGCEDGDPESCPAQSPCHSSLLCSTELFATPKGDSSSKWLWKLQSQERRSRSSFPGCPSLSLWGALCWFLIPIPLPSPAFPSAPTFPGWRGPGGAWSCSEGTRAHLELQVGEGRRDSSSLCCSEIRGEQLGKGISLGSPQISTWDLTRKREFLWVLPQISTWELLRLWILPGSLRAREMLRFQAGFVKEEHKVLSVSSSGVTGWAGAPLSPPRRGQQQLGLVPGGPRPGLAVPAAPRNGWRSSQELPPCPNSGRVPGIFWELISVAGI